MNQMGRFMKLIKQHKLAVAICLACGVNSAQAAINNGGPTVQPLGSGTSGEMFLSVFDSGISTSFAIDLGTTVEDFLSSAEASRSWDLGSSFTSFAALSNDPLIFNVAGNNTYPGLKATNNSVNFGDLVSRRTGQTYVGGNQNVLQLSQSFGVKVSARAININTGTDSNQTDFAANNSITTSNTNNQSYWTKEWGSNMGLTGYTASATVRNGEVTPLEATAGVTLDLAWFHASAGSAATSKALYDVLNGYLTLDVPASTLTWHSNVAEVPLPATVWLFLGGLMSILKFKRRSEILTPA